MPVIQFIKLYEHTNTGRNMTYYSSVTLLNLAGSEQYTMQVNRWCTVYDRGALFQPISEMAVFLCGRVLLWLQWKAIQTGKYAMGR